MTRPAPEHAVEEVVRWLEEHGHHDLAHQVAVVTDPDPPLSPAAEEALRRWIRPEVQP